ncbi:MAG TPA: mechanosensitive ion channel domain-containing protein [Casimicrobiaceae bacterium]|nr:mechanosensitive ion channel domain-containing protein [Casimicrobiaceae bacterium]
MDSFDAWLASLPFDRHPAWTTWVTAAIVTLIAYVIATVAMRVVARLAARHRGWSAFAAGVARPGCLLVAALAASLVLNAAPDDVPLIGGIRHVAALVVIAAFTWAAIGALRGMSAAIVVRHPTNLQDNLAARRVLTQARVLTRTLTGVVAVVGVAFALITFPQVRQIGASLLASAGVAGLVAGLAARSVLGNLIAGLQIALTQPLRIDDVLIVAGEWGRVEEITSAFVVMALWDQRRLIVPLQYLIEQPFQNWTRRSAEILGTAFLWVDPTLPVAPLRAEAERICKSAPEWDGRVCVVQVTDMSEAAMQLRFLVSSADSGRNFDLRCKMREGVIAFIQQRHPDGLPRRRIDVEREPSFPRTRESSRDATTTRASR